MAMDGFISDCLSLSSSNRNASANTTKGFFAMDIDELTSKDDLLLEMMYIKAKKGLKKFLPQNLSDRHLDSLIEEMTPPEKGQRKDVLRPASLFIIYSISERNDTIPLSDDQLFRYFVAYFMSLKMERLQRDGKITLLEKLTLDTVLFSEPMKHQRRSK